MFSDLVVKNLPANAGDIGNMGSIPGSGKSLGGGHFPPWQPTPVLLPGESHGQRSLAGLLSMGLQKSQTDTIQRFNCNKFNVLQIHMK